MDLYAEWERTHVDVNDLKQKKKRKTTKVKTRLGRRKRRRLKGITSRTRHTCGCTSTTKLQQTSVCTTCKPSTTCSVGDMSAISPLLSSWLGINCTASLATTQLQSWRISRKLHNMEMVGEFCTYCCVVLADRNEINEYIPGPLLSSTNRSAVAEQVLSSYKSFMNSWCVQSTQQARLAYLRLCKRQPFYGLTLFHVRNYRQLAVLPSRVILAINDMGVSVLGADSDEVLAMFPYADIASWGYSANSFVFVVIRGTEETEYSFKTTQVRCSSGFVPMMRSSNRSWLSRARALTTTWPLTSTTLFH